jgi:hypothetical protein
MTHARPEGGHASRTSSRASSGEADSGRSQEDRREDSGRSWVRATPDGAHVQGRRAFTLRWGDIGPLGVPTAIPTWAASSKHRNGQLPAPIHAALDEWRRLKGGEIADTIVKLQREKFIVKLTDPT